MSRRKTFQDRVLDVTAFVVLMGIGLVIVIGFIDRLPA